MFFFADRLLHLQAVFRVSGKMLPYVQSGIFPTTLNTACRRSKQSAKKNILSVARVVTFEATPKFWGMEDWIKWCKERTRWMRIKAFPVGVDYMAWCTLSIDLCALSSSSCCTIVANLPSLMIICSFFSRFCTSSFSSHCSSKPSWESLEISVLSSGGIDMAIAAYNSWGELIYHLFGTDLLRSIFILFWPSVSKSCPHCAATMRQVLRPYRWQFNTFRDIELFHWPCR